MAGIVVWQVKPPLGTPDHSTAPVLIQLPANVSWKTTEDGWSNWTLWTVNWAHVEDQNEVCGSWPHSVCTWLLQPFGKWTRDGRPFSVFQTDKHILHNTSIFFYKNLIFRNLIRYLKVFAISDLNSYFITDVIFLNFRMCDKNEHLRKM